MHMCINDILINALHTIFQLIIKHIVRHAHSVLQNKVLPITDIPFFVKYHTAGTWNTAIVSVLYI